MRILKSLLIFAVSFSESISVSNADHSAEFEIGKYKLQFQEHCKNHRCFGWVKRTGNGSRKVKTITWKRCTEAKINAIKKLNTEKKLKLDFKLPSCVPSSSITVNDDFDFKKQ